MNTAPVTKGWGNNSDKNSLNIKLYTLNIKTFYISKISQFKKKR